MSGMQQASYLEGGPLMWLFPLYLHVNQKSNYDIWSLPKEATTSSLQVWLGLPSVVYHPRGMQFPCTVYICNQGPLLSVWAHYISCAHSACRRSCCCPLQCNRWRKETLLNSARGLGPYCRSWPSSFLHLLSVLSLPLLLNFQVKNLEGHSNL